MLVLTGKSGCPTDFASPGCSGAHQDIWSKISELKRAVEKDSVETGVLVYISPAEDRARETNTAPQYRLKMAGLFWTNRKGLAT